MDTSIVSNALMKIGSNYSLSSTSSPPTSSFLTTKANTHAIADTGATKHYIRVDAPTFNVTKATNPITVRLPDHSTMSNTHEAFIRIPKLPRSARRAYLFPTMQESLLSIGQLCDDGCTAVFDRKRVVISYQNEIHPWAPCRMHGLSFERFKAPRGLMRSA